MTSHTAIYLVRHAHAHWTPDENRPLSSQGKAGAVRVAEHLQHLPIETVYASPACRALQTITPLAKRLNLTIRTEPDLRERELGSEPVSDFLSAVQATWVNPDFAWPGGEPNAVAQRRGVAVVEDLMVRHRGEQIVAGAHGTLLALILQHYDASVDFAFWQSLTMPDIYRLEVEPTGARFTRLWRT